MATSPQGSKLGRRITWRSAAACLLVIIGLASLTGFMAVHWIERQVLTTDNWVKVVGPLPKDDKVATALSTYTVNQVFTATDLEDRIEEALPDRAAFLAPPLADQLQTRLTKRTKQVIQSDQFETVWTAANRAASERLLNSARNQGTDQPKREARFSLDLTSLKGTVNDILEKRAGQGDVAVAPAPSGKRVGLAVDLKTSLDKAKQYIRTIDFLNATLWLLAAVCIVGAVVLSRSRRRLLLIVTATITAISLLQIIGVKALRPPLLNQVADASYRPAVGVVYDTLVASFRDTAVTMFILSIVAFALVFVLHKPLLSRSKTIADWLKQIERSKLWKQWLGFRAWVGAYRLQIMATAIVLGLAIVAFAVEPTPRTGTRAALFIILSLELISLVALARAPRGKPMKQ